MDDLERQIGIKYTEVYLFWLIEVYSNDQRLKFDFKRVGRRVVKEKLAVVRDCLAPVVVKRYLAEV